MEIVGILAQIGAGLWILNVWILRFNKETEFRGGDAKNMLEEFQTYGICLLYTSPSPRDRTRSRMPSSA